MTSINDFLITFNTLNIGESTMSDILLWPETPTREKTYRTVRFSFVISSKSRKKDTNNLDKQQKEEGEKKEKEVNRGEGKKTINKVNFNKKRKHVANQEECCDMKLICINNDKIDQEDDTTRPLFKETDPDFEEKSKTKKRYEQNTWSML